MTHIALWRPRVAVGFVVAVSIGLALVGCSSGSPGAAPPAAPQAQASAPSTADPAQAFADCMTQAGTAMQVVTAADGTEGIWAKGIRLGAWSKPGDTSFPLISDTDRPIDEATPVIQLMKQAQTAHPDSWLLVADGKDLSVAFDTCVKSSGYTDVTFKRNPAAT